NPDKGGKPLLPRKRGKEQMTPSRIQDRTDHPFHRSRGTADNSVRWRERADNSLPRLRGRAGVGAKRARQWMPPRLRSRPPSQPSPVNGGRSRRPLPAYSTGQTTPPPPRGDRPTPPPAGGKAQPPPPPAGGGGGGGGGPKSGRGSGCPPAFGPGPHPNLPP